MKILLETERLILREFLLEDASDLNKLDNNPDVMKYISSYTHKEIPLSQSQAAVERQINYYREHPGLGLWAAILKGSNEFIGWNALKYLDKTEDVEIGYRYLPQFWNKGYATEASLALIKYGFNTLKLSEITAVAMPGNAASRRVLEKIGMKFIRYDHFYNTEVAFYSIKNALKEQYKTAENLIARGNLHSYNTNKTDWNNWCFSQMRIPDKARILELGCGTGDFWYENRQSLKKDWSITLSDFSMGMLESAKKKLENIDFSFIYKEIDAQDIPYENGCFDIVIARHMLYLVPDIEKALSEIKRVLAKGGTLYITTNAHDTMAELNVLLERFDPAMELHNNGMCYRFDMGNGYLLLKKYFSEVSTEILQGKIVVDKAEPIVTYKASTIKGSSILVGEKKEEFAKYVEDYIRENGSLSITTKACIFKARK